MTSCQGWADAVSAVVGLLVLISMIIVGSRWSEASSMYRAVLLLGFLVVAVALYRSILPNDYETRRVWRDTPANSVIAVRLLALFAEISFACMIVISYMMATGAWAAEGVSVSVTIFATLVIVAQIPATIGAQTALPWLFALEETLWALGAVALIPASLWLTRQGGRTRTMGIVMMVALSIYLVFQAVTVPMRWAAGHLGVPVSTLSWFSTTNASMQCENYSLLHFVWITGYLILMSLLVVYLQTGPAAKNV